ncbi:hypothetical protein [Calothrix sp. NIES-2098]|uniref:hypothetical protein n=1 Tax=Calothrix sp. NIES-2098 TaxID=1954171 RepID=UPI0030DA5A13
MVSLDGISSYKFLVNCGEASKPANVLTPSLLPRTYTREAERLKCKSNEPT